MAYSTIDTVKKKIDLRILLQLLNDDVRPEEEINLNDEADPVVINFNQCADDAQVEIDPYLRGRYKLPLSPVPGLIVSISDEITKYNIYKRRGNIPEEIMNIKKANDKMLEKIADGKMDIGVSNEPQSLKNEITTNKTAADKYFNKDLWNKF